MPGLTFNPCPVCGGELETTTKKPKAPPAREYMRVRCCNCGITLAKWDTAYVSKFTEDNALLEAPVAPAYNPQVKTYLWERTHEPTLGDQETQKHMDTLHRRNLAAEVGRGLLEAGAIKIETTPTSCTPYGLPKTKYSATIKVVLPEKEEPEEWKKKK